MPVEIMVLQMQRYQKYFRKMSMYNDVFSVVLRQLVCYDKEKQQLGLFRTIFETLSLYCFNKSKIIFEGMFLQKYGCLKDIDNFL